MWTELLKLDEICELLKIDRNIVPGFVKFEYQKVLEFEVNLFDNM